LLRRVFSLLIGIVVLLHMNGFRQYIFRVRTASRLKEVRPRFDLWEAVPGLCAQGIDVFGVLVLGSRSTLSFENQLRINRDILHDAQQGGNRHRTEHTPPVGAIRKT